MSHSIKDSKEAGGAKVLRGHSPDQVMSWSAIKAVGKREEAEACGRLHFSSQKMITHHVAMLFWGWLNTCSSIGSDELIPWSALPVGAAFA